MIPDRKIVQKWRGADWPKGHYSTVTFELREHGSKTILDFTQTGIPEDLYADLKDGWVISPKRREKALEASCSRTVALNPTS